MWPSIFIYFVGLMLGGGIGCIVTREWYKRKLSELVARADQQKHYYEQRQHDLYYSSYRPSQWIN